MTRAELFAGNSATDFVSQLIVPHREVHIDRSIAERAGRGFSLHLIPELAASPTDELHPVLLMEDARRTLLGR